MIDRERLATQWLYGVISVISVAARVALAHWPHERVADAVVVLAWIPVTLGLDSGATLVQQHLLGLMTWCLLLWLLRGETPLVRMQTAVVIVFATIVEYTFSPWLEVYTYRFDNVPAFVPPGHGLVYLAALCMGRSTFFRTHARSLVRGHRRRSGVSTPCGGSARGRRGRTFSGSSGTAACWGSWPGVGRACSTSVPSSSSPTSS